MRDEVVISTKIGYDFYNHTARRGQQERPQDWSEEFIRFALEQSLKRLDTDYIDFLQLHNTKMDAIEDDGLFALMRSVSSEGKIRAYGIALGPKIGWLEEGVRAMRERRIEGVQMIYNLLEQDPGQGPIETASETDTSLIVRVPHSSGMLEGHYDENTTFAKRPPSSPSERVAHHGPEEGGATLLPHRIRQAYPRPGRTQIRPRPPEVVSTLPNIYGKEQIEEFAATSRRRTLRQKSSSRVAELYEDNFGWRAVSRSACQLVS